MKHYFILTVFSFMTVISVFGQHLRGDEVPSAIRTNFQKTFPEAEDIDWEKKEDIYKVEFEIGFWNDDNSAWYREDGTMIRHKKEISKKALPDKVRNAIDKNYKYYWIKDVIKDSKRDETTYSVELRSLIDEWDVVFGSDGEELSKVRD